MYEEIAMVSALAGMGIYFVKSTDLPKELKDRSKILADENNKRNAIKLTKNVDFSKMGAINTADKKKVNSLVVKANQIDELILKITTLEQELVENTKRSEKLKQSINQHLTQVESIKKNHLN